MAWRAPLHCLNTFPGELSVFQGGDETFEANVHGRCKLSVNLALIPHCSLVCVIGSVPQVVALLNLEGFNVGRG